MPQDFEQTIKDIFGESFSKVTQFQSDQMKKLTDKLADIAREALKDDLTKLHTEIGELRARLTVLEGERLQQAADAIEPSF
jgi:predicted neutral ceramidase superfamily lipid hydrolase